MFVGSRQRKTLKSSKSFASLSGFWSNTYNFLNKGGWQLANPAALISTLENSQMKKTLIAMAAVAVAGVASAQATITGAFNLDMQNTNAAAAKTIGMGDATVTIAASEDLGGGLSAAVSTTIQTAGGRNSDTTNNGYSMSIGGGFGKLTLSNYLNGSAGLSAGVSAVNDMADAAGGYTARTRVAYDLPAMVDGLSVQLRWDNTSALLTAANGNNAAADSEDVGAVSSFTTTKYSVTYATGPVSLNVTGDNKGGARGYTGTYDAGIAKVAMYSTTGQQEYTVTAPMGGLDVGVHMLSGDNKATGMTASYALSKRTSVRYSYVNQTAVKSTNAAASVGGNYRLRLAHSF